MPKKRVAIKYCSPFLNEIVLRKILNPINILKTPKKT